MYNLWINIYYILMKLKGTIEPPIVKVFFKLKGDFSLNIV